MLVVSHAPRLSSVAALVARSGGRKRTLGTVDTRESASVAGRFPRASAQKRRALLPCRPDKRPTTGTPHYTDTAALLPFPDPPSLSSAPSSPPLLSSSPPLLLSSLPIQKPKVHLIICGSSTCVNFSNIEYMHKCEELHLLFLK